MQQGQSFNKSEATRSQQPLSRLRVKLTGLENTYNHEPKSPSAINSWAMDCAPGPDAEWFTLPGNRRGQLMGNYVSQKNAISI